MGLSYGVCGETERAGTPQARGLPRDAGGFRLGFQPAKGLPCPFDSHTDPLHPSGLSWSFHQNKYFPWRFLLVEALGLAGAPGSRAGPGADESLGRKSSPTFPKLPFSPSRNKPKLL